MRKFLTAKWLDLIMANYEVDPSLLADDVPSGTTLDLYQGKCFVSLVGFMFLDTRVLSVAIPFHRDFEEVNLRFYTRRTLEGEIRQGVTFLKEIVPLPAVSIVARVAYGEPYETWRMRHSNDGTRIGYEWSRRGIRNRLSVTIGDDLGVPPAGSCEEFIVEHYWGYTRRSERRTDEYLVEHPPWRLNAASGADINVDFGRTYGDRFAFLSEQRPYSVLFAKGSDVSVYQGSRISS
jgi:uncharacterized protein